MKECVNCGTMTDTPHCPNCGQKMTVKRVSFRSIIEEFFSKWIGFDNQFGRTVISMLTMPEQVVHAYLHGNRTKYIGPLGYVVIMTALLIISFDLFGLEAQDFIKENQSTFEELYQQDLPEEKTVLQKQTTQKINEFAARNFRFLSALLIPFWAISFWFFYRKEKLNYIERLVVATYLSCEGMWLTIISIAIFALTGYLPTVPIFLISLAYYSYALHKIFPDKEAFFAVVKGAFSVVVGFLIFFLSAIILGIVIGIFWAIQNPELFQQQG